MAKKGPTAKRYDEKTKKKVAEAIAKGKMTVAQARREYGVTGSQTINGWLRKYAPDYRGARAAQGKKAGVKKGATKAAAKPAAKGGAKKGRASGKKAGRGRPATRARR